MHFKNTVRLLSIIMLFISIIMLIPAFYAMIIGENMEALAFIKTCALIFLISTVMLIITKNTISSNIGVKDGYLFTTLTWILITAFGAIPLVLTGTLEHYSSAFFEIMSGFTTTGASRIEDVESVSKSILLWRSMTNWLGGMGVVVLFVALLPSLGKSDTYTLMGAETVGPVKGKLTPKTKTTALVLWEIYVCLTALEIIILKLEGLSLFDAITVSMSTVSTAGFCVKNASIGAFGKVSVEYTVAIFMLLAGINFSLYYKAFSGKLKEALFDSELDSYCGIVLFSTVLGTLCLRLTNTYSLEKAFRKMLFHISSVITTTGFSTADYSLWPSFAVFILILLCFIGGCAGSTAGGVKVARINIMTKGILSQTKKKLHPSAVAITTVDNKPVNSETITSVFAFFGLYIATWIIGSLVVSLSGLDIASCLFSTLSCLGNIGLGEGSAGPAFYSSEFPLWTNWVYSFLMLSGRLELFTVYVLFSRDMYAR